MLPANRVRVFLNITIIFIQNVSGINVLNCVPVLISRRRISKLKILTPFWMEISLPDHRSGKLIKESVHSICPLQNFYGNTHTSGYDRPEIRCPVAKNRFTLSHMELKFILA